MSTGKPLLTVTHRLIVKRPEPRTRIDTEEGFLRPCCLYHTCVSLSALHCVAVKGRCVYGGTCDTHYSRLIIAVFQQGGVTSEKVIIYHCVWSGRVALPSGDLQMPSFGSIMFTPLEKSHFADLAMRIMTTGSSFFHISNHWKFENSWCTYKLAPPRQPAPPSQWQL